MHFFKVVSPWFWSKNMKILYCFLLDTCLLEKVFGDVLYRKLPLFDHKNIDFKKSLNLHFSKVVSPWFWSKNLKSLYCFFLDTCLLEKVFGDVLYRKLPLFDHKNIDLKKSQILHFLQVVCPRFWWKIWNFVNVSFKVSFS